MRRVNKCVGKRKYSHFDVALGVAKRQYKYFKRDVAIYECPTCLDFHLSTKHCNTQKYHRRWLQSLNQEINNEYNKLFPVKKQKPVVKKKLIKLNPESKTQILEKREAERKKLLGVLPLAKQKEILSTLAKNSFPQSKSFLSRIVDIIKEVGDRW